MRARDDAAVLVDTHMHVPRLSTLKPAWLEWADQFGAPGWRDVFDEDGDPVPARVDALLESRRVMRALLFCEYSPRATGIQSIDDVLPFQDHNPERFHLVAVIDACCPFNAVTKSWSAFAAAVSSSVHAALRYPTVMSRPSILSTI
jgi:predicted TIM-barrel fold metal-dependent hydrolase